jgi:AraC-like DNA-binding protein
LELRLNRARQLLLQTNLSIIDVSLACGFVSAPHFSKCYRDFFGIPPREERRRFSPGQSVRIAEENLQQNLKDKSTEDTKVPPATEFDCISW